MEEKLIKRLMASMKCDSCGEHYEMYNIDILSHQEDMWVLRVLCSGCQSQSLVAAIVKEGKMSEVVTDLAEAELDKFRDNMIEADDVLNMYSFLKDFDGDFSQLFEREGLE